MRPALPVVLATLTLALGSSQARAQEASAEGLDGGGIRAPKLAVVVVGDPDPELQAAALRVERAVGERLRAPFDPGLRAALRGAPGEGEDGLEEVRRERRRLGLDEARDTALLASLGRRAGAQAVASIRAGARAPELSVLDVEAAALYEGTLELPSSLSDALIARFVVRRAQASGQRREAEAQATRPVAETPGPELPAPALPSTDPAGPSLEEPAIPPTEPDFFERFWPYMVAGALLAGMITAIALTSGGSSGADQPVLRFGPPR